VTVRKRTLLILALAVCAPVMAQDPEADPRAELARATALAEAGELIEARTILESVVESAGADDPALLRRAEYNLGAIQLKQALTPVEQEGSGEATGIDATRAMAMLTDAERSFLASAAMDRTDLDAARNVEYVRRLKKQIKEQQEQQKKQDQGQQQKQQNQGGGDQSQKQQQAQKQQQSDQAQQSAD